ncbi:MAG: lycopene beta-cyclase CrtY [Pseudomonadota bacterium]
MSDFDVILVGGGLSAGLIARALSGINNRATAGAEQPGPLRILIVDRANEIAGNHTWSFHQTDVTPDHDAWLAPIVSARWATQETRFPTYKRPLDIGYRAIASQSFAVLVRALPGVATLTDTRVVSLANDHIVVDGGQRLTAPCIIDCRGAVADTGLTVGYQKFVGLEIELEEPHGLARPVIMDADLTQIDGYRFMYLLPFDQTRLLVEDTYYSDYPALEIDDVSARIRTYVGNAGWRIKRFVRDEAGVLPIVLAGKLQHVWPDRDPIPRAGMRAGLFHQTTGYSLPLAVETAHRLAALPALTTRAAEATVRTLARDTWNAQAYFRLLNRTMFVAPEPLRRRRIFERFYKLSPGLIGRFFAGQLRAHDKLRLLTGRPPVPMFKAFRAFHPGAAIAWADQRAARAEHAFDGRTVTTRTPLDLASRYANDRERMPVGRTLARDISAKPPIS